MNVGRFHPIEKAVQFCADALPFVLVGVGGEALAAYFVFYAVNASTSIRIATCASGRSTTW